MKKKRIAFLPVNLATIPSTTAEWINKTGLVEARVLSISDSKYWTPNEFTKILKTYEKGWKNPFLNIYYNSIKVYYLLKYIWWADMIYWVWDSALPFQLDLRLIKLLRKPLLIEWMGSDIRIPELIFDNNKFYKKAWDEDYPYKVESEERSHSIQRNFAKANAFPVLSPEMMLYLIPGLFKQTFSLMQRVDLTTLLPAYPAKDNQKPVIVHTPSSHSAKGTKYVREAITQLKGKYDFEYVEITNVSREEALKIIGNADIFIDQVIFGNYGLAASEAMAMGKPVVCYLMEMMLKVLPQDCPIVNANPDNLYLQLARMIEDPALRHNIGLKSRNYVEKYHDAEKIAYQVIDIFNSIKK